MIMQLVILQTLVVQGVGLTEPSVGDKRISSKGGNGAANPVVGLGFLNGTDFVLIHAAIPSDATYLINYTNNPSSTNNQTAVNGQGSGAFYALGQATDNRIPQGEGTSTNKMLKIGSNATAKDWMVPSVVSAEISKSNPKQVRVLMSEGIVNVNATVAHFNFTEVKKNQPVIDNIVAGNGSSYLYINLKNAADISDVLTLQFTTGAAEQGLNVINSWITDAIDSTKLY